MHVSDVLPKKKTVQLSIAGNSYYIDIYTGNFYYINIYTDWYNSYC